MNSFNQNNKIQEGYWGWGQMRSFFETGYMLVQQPL